MGAGLNKNNICILAGAVLVAGMACAEEPVSEQDYFGTLPVVLTVSRLAQPLSDTPGAVTVLDRDKIHRSGARDVTELLRLVPGYLVGGWNGANPNAVYHAPLDEYGTRNLVMIDGRSVYSSALLGDTHRGILGVMLEDIERIEVLRGSNSAAYGANAMFGVINIITRHSQDTRGGEVSITGGDVGINDNRARFGWGDDKASFRLSVGKRQDNGFRNVNDDLDVSQFHFRGDLYPNPSNEILLEAGSSQIEAGDGFPGNNSNSPRTVSWRDWYMHSQWRHQVSESEEIKLSANFDEETLRDRSPFLPLPALILDYGGRGRRLNLEAQHQLGLGEGLRGVWGLGYKYENVLSRSLFARNDPVSMAEGRLFGNLEWRLHPQWLINAGLFFGHNNWTGGYTSPRLMANFNLTPEHTLRLGATRSERAPNLLELAGDVRHYLGPVLLNWELKSSGTARAETLRTVEAGYLGNFREANLTLDVRVYRERMKDIVDAKGDTPGIPPDYVNYLAANAKGVEYQLRWKPLADSEIWLNQNFQHYEYMDPPDLRSDRQPPTHATTLALFQKLPAGFDLSVIYVTSGKMTWRGRKDALTPDRLDARLAYAFLLGGHRSELAVAVQALDGDQPVFLPTKNFVLQRRTFATLRFEF